MAANWVNMKARIEKIMLFAILGVIVALSWMKPLDVTAEKQVDDGFKRAVSCFAVARVLNGIISVAQGTEISFSLGVGATLTPGQILDPVNDLVEQFSEMMLIASVAFGIMKILIIIGKFWLFSAILSVIAFAWAAFKVTGRLPPLLLTKVLLVLVVVRFSVPLVTLGNELVYKQFLADGYNESQLAIENSKSKLTPMTLPAVTPTVVTPPPATTPPPTVTTPSPTTQSSGLMDRIKGAFVSVSQTVVSIPQVIKDQIKQYDPKPYIANLEKQASQLVDSIIKLIVVFVLQTVVMPLIFMWVLYRSCLALMDSAGRKRVASA